MAKNSGKNKGSLADYTILIIDDDMWIQRLFSKYLKEWGFEPVSAFDPYEGLALAVKRLPLAIFLDIYLPDVPGDVILKMMRTIETTKDIPIFSVSANFDKALLKDTYQAGATDFLSKPVKQSKIYEVLKENLPEEIINSLGDKFKVIE